MAEELGNISVNKTFQRQPPSEFAQFLAEGMMLGARPSTHIVNPQAVQQVKSDAMRMQEMQAQLAALQEQVAKPDRFGSDLNMMQKIGLVIGAAGESIGGTPIYSNYMKERLAKQERVGKEWKPQTQEQAMAFEQAKTNQFLTALAAQNQPAETKGIRELSAPSITKVSDLIPMPEQTTKTMPYKTAQGMGVKNIIDPSYTKKMDIWKKDVQEVETMGGSLEQLAAGFEDLIKYAKEKPDFKAGIGGQTLAKGQTFLDKYSGQPWALNYERANARLMNPTAQQVFGASKVLSDRDLAVVQQTLSKPELPKQDTFNAVRDVLRGSAKPKLEAELKARGISVEDYAKIYPNSARVILGYVDKNDPRVQKALKAGYTMEEISSHLSGGF